MNTSIPSPPQFPTLISLPPIYRSSLAPYLPSNESSAPEHNNLTSTLHPDSPNTTTSNALSTSTAELSKADLLPHLTLTYATSLDASLSLATGTKTTLSGPESKAMTHYLRAVHDAILVGANTAIVDDPSLNCRHVTLRDEDEAIIGTESGFDVAAQMAVEMAADRRRQQPIPVILDPSARWRAPVESMVLKLAREGNGKGVLWVIGKEVRDVEDGGEDELRDAVGRVRDVGGDVIFAGPRLRSGGGGVDWELLLKLLAERGVRSVMVEGGAKVIMDLLRARNQKLVSSIIITIAPVWLGEGGVVVSPPRKEAKMEVGRLVNVKWLSMGEDVVMAGEFPQCKQSQH